MTGLSHRAKRWLVAAAVLAVIVLLRLGEGQGTGPGLSPDAGEGGAQRVERAWEERESGFMVEVSGRVDRTLDDDDRGSRHQRFILRLDGGRTLLVAHNIDLAERVPLAEGDVVSVRGQYEWNDRGGLLHWTHADPDGRRWDTGWIDHAGRRYE